MADQGESKTNSEGSVAPPKPRNKRGANKKNESSKTDDDQRLTQATPEATETIPGGNVDQEHGANNMQDPEAPPIPGKKKGRKKPAPAAGPGESLSTTSQQSQHKTKKKSIPGVDPAEPLSPVDPAPRQEKKKRESVSNAKPLSSTTLRPPRTPSGPSLAPSEAQQTGAASSQEPTAWSKLTTWVRKFLRQDPSKQSIKKPRTQSPSPSPSQRTPERPRSVQEVSSSAPNITITEAAPSVSTVGFVPPRGPPQHESLPLRGHLPHPPVTSIDADIEDEIYSTMSRTLQSSGTKAVPASKKYLTVDKATPSPDDELLFTLTPKEEIVFRRGIADMRWEEEVALSSGAEYISSASSSETSDTERAAAAILWERMGQRKMNNIPIITVNGRRVSYSHLDRSRSEASALSDKPEPGKKTQKDDGSSSDSDTNSRHIWDLIDEAENIKEQMHEGKHASRFKLWRRQLTVVIILMFVMKARNLFNFLCELFTPVLFCGFLIAGMVYCTDVHHQTIVDTRKDTGFDPFDTVTAQTLMTSVCSNTDCNTEGDLRNYFFVYAPSNNFTDDLMVRALKHMQLDQVHDDGSNDDYDEEGKAKERKVPLSKISKLIGVNTPEEVSKICSQRWHQNSQPDSLKDELAEAQQSNVGGVGAGTATQDLGQGERIQDKLRYPYGIIFSMENNLVGKVRLKNINEDKDVPRHIQYTIRSFYPEITNTVEGFPFREQTAKATEHKSRLSPYSIHTGFVGLTMALDFAFAEKILEKAERVDPYMQIGETKTSRRAFFNQFLTQPLMKQFDYPAFHDKNAKIRVWLSVTLAVSLSYFLLDMLAVSQTVLEHNRGSIEMLKIHGMTTAMKWIANLIVVIILRAIPALGIALIIHFLMSVESVSQNYSVIALWLFLWMHACTCSYLNLFVISTFIITKPEIAGIMVVCINMVSMCLPVLFFVQWDSFHFIMNLALCFLLPQWNFANGLYYYLKFEIYEEGLSWYDFPVFMDLQNHKVISLPLSCLLFLYASIFYMLLAIYFDHILPREFSPRENWLFFLNFCTRRRVNTAPTRPIPRSMKPTVLEPGPMNCVYGPRFRGVTVHDPSNKVTVLDNISLDIYENEITCIIGQIGSGKSDFLNVIAGVVVPSAGFVDVKGLRVHEFHDLTNRHVSFCPQRKLLIESLSVEEHVIACCMLHGAPYATAKYQASYLMQMFGLMPMRRHSYTGLTANDAKKLMLAMALSKSPSVLLLDNPIDELDTESRSQFWKLLQELKPMRSIVVTCTTLEEAQMYADRIAILSKGKLICYGSPQYIRLAYGVGNIMTLKMIDGYEPDVYAMKKLLHKELRGAQTTLLETQGVSMQTGTVKFIMPYGKFLGSLLEKLEDSMEDYGISKIFMHPPSLWALFEKISTSPGIEQSLAKREIKMIREPESGPKEKFVTAANPPVPELTEETNRSWVNISKGLILKKWWYYRQKYFFFLVAYIPQLLMLFMVPITCQLFVFVKPEGIARIISSYMYPNISIMFRSMDNEHTRNGWEEAFGLVVLDEDPGTRVQIVGPETDIEHILAEGRGHSLTQLKKQAIVAFSKDKSGFVGHYSSNSLHSAAIAGHLMMQAFLHLISPNRNKTYGTTLISHPFSQYEGFPVGSTQNVSSTIFGIYLSIILNLLSMPMLRMILRERETNFKAIQRLTGVSSSLYWLSHGVADFILYLVITIFAWLMILLLDKIYQPQLDGQDEIVALLIIMGLWLCWTALPYTYLIACWLPARRVGFGHSILFHFLTGIIPKVITYQLMRLKTPSSTSHWWPNLIRYFLYIFPTYSLTSACVHYFHIVGDEHWCSSLDTSSTGECKMYEDAKALVANETIMDEVDTDNDRISENALHFLTRQLIHNDTLRTCCKAYCSEAGTCHHGSKFLRWPSTAEIPLLQHDCVALFINGLGFWILLILYEKRVIQGIFKYLKQKVCGNLEKSVALKDVKATEEPEDVRREQHNVDFMIDIEGDVDSEVFLVQDLTKFFTYVKGLDHIYFSVPVHSVTGILGLPKSGKSTILNLLTCQISPSSGYVYKDNDVLEGKSMKRLLSDVGYCPQKPFLLPYLSGAQMLTVMGRIRGLSNFECQRHVLLWMELFDLQDVANTKCGNYRNGQKRRLCCAMALIGDIETAIFDEPTASMDNSERYIFWNVISRIHDNAPKTIVFASVNAEEVQNQSTKTLLMESGALVAVGHLNDIFKNNNQGYTLTIRYGFPSNRQFTDLQRMVKLDKFKDYVIEYLSPCSLIDEQDSVLIYNLKDTTLKLSKVYTAMEGAKVKFTTLVRDFQVYELSLDDIILQYHKNRVRYEETYMK